MPATGPLLSAHELHLLDAAITATPAGLRDRTGLLLLRHGLTPVQICALLRTDYTRSEPGLPAQITFPAPHADEIILLSAAAENAVNLMLLSHDSFRILPGMVPERLAHLLTAALHRAQLRTVAADVLRASVRPAALAGRDQ